jgi:ABC-2 type transport system permease protein
MKDAIRSEWLKLRTTRTTWWLFGGMLAWIGLLSWFALASAPAGALEAGLVGVPVWLVVLSVLPIFVLVLAIRSFTDEVRHGSIVPTLLATPERRIVLLAKVLVLSGAGIAFALAATGLGVGVTAIWFVAEGVTPTVVAGSVTRAVGRTVLVAALWSALGVGIGAAVRHQVAAIVGALAWVLAVEQILETAMPNLATFLPAHAANAAIGFGTTVAVRPVVGAIVLGGWALASVALADRLMARRDVA